MDIIIIIIYLIYYVIQYILAKTIEEEKNELVTNFI